VETPSSNTTRESKGMQEGNKFIYIGGKVPVIWRFQ